MISRQAHTITVLVMFSCILVYVTLFEEETYGADYNNKRYILWFFVVYEENLGEFQVEYKIWFLVCTDLEPRFQIQGHGHKKSRTKYLWSKVIWICINGYTMCSDLEWISDSKLKVTGNLLHYCSLLEPIGSYLENFSNDCLIHYLHPSIWNAGIQKSFTCSSLQNININVEISQTL